MVKDQVVYFHLYLFTHDCVSVVGSSFSRIGECSIAKKSADIFVQNIPGADASKTVLSSGLNSNSSFLSALPLWVGVDTV